jgi:hypothetical protein
MSKKFVNMQCKFYPNCASMGTCPYKHGDGCESQGLTAMSKGGPMGIIGGQGKSSSPYEL